MADVTDRNRSIDSVRMILTRIPQGLDLGEMIIYQSEGNDSVTAIVERRIISKEAIKVVGRALIASLG